MLNVSNRASIQFKQLSFLLRTFYEPVFDVPVLSVPQRDPVVRRLATKIVNNFLVHPVVVEQVKRAGLFALFVGQRELWSIIVVLVVVRGVVIIQTRFGLAFDCLGKKQPDNFTNLLI